MAPKCSQEAQHIPVMFPIGPQDIPKRLQDGSKAVQNSFQNSQRYWRIIQKHPRCSPTPSRPSRPRAHFCWNILGKTLVSQENRCHRDVLWFCGRFPHLPRDRLLIFMTTANPDKLEAFAKPYMMLLRGWLCKWSSEYLAFYYAEMLAINHIIQRKICNDPDKVCLLQFWRHIRFLIMRPDPQNTWYAYRRCTDDDTYKNMHVYRHLWIWQYLSWCLSEVFVQMQIGIWIRYTCVFVNIYTYTNFVGGSGEAWITFGGFTQSVITLSCSHLFCGGILQGIRIRGTNITRISVGSTQSHSVPPDAFLPRSWSVYHEVVSPQPPLHKAPCIYMHGVARFTK